MGKEPGTLLAAKDLGNNWNIQICAQPYDDRGLVCSDWRGKFIYVHWDINMVFNLFHHKHFFCHSMGGKRFGK